VISMLSGNIIEKVIDQHPNIPILNSTLINTTNLNTLSLAEYRVSIACSLSLLVGTFQLVFALSGISIIASYFSDTFISAYTCASGFLVVINQLKQIFGLKNAIKYNGMFKVVRVSTFQMNRIDVFF
jgi:MFS superfamily sulfate permease-like transporter